MESKWMALSSINIRFTVNESFILSTPIKVYSEFCFDTGFSPDICCGEPIFKVFQLLVRKREGLESVHLGFTLQRKRNNTVELASSQPLNACHGSPSWLPKQTTQKMTRKRPGEEKGSIKRSREKSLLRLDVRKWHFAAGQRGGKMRWALRVAAGLKTTLSGLHGVWYHSSGLLIRVSVVDLKHSTFNQTSASVFGNGRYLKSPRLDVTVDILTRAKRGRRRSAFIGDQSIRF